MNYLLRIIVLFHLGTSLFIHGAAQPAMSSTDEIKFNILSDKGSIHINYDASNPPTKRAIEAFEEQLQNFIQNLEEQLQKLQRLEEQAQKLQNDISKLKRTLGRAQNNDLEVPSLNPPKHLKITEAHIHISDQGVNSSIDLSVFTNFLRFFPHIETLEINHRSLSENDAENLTGAIQRFAPNLKNLIIRNRISAQAWNKLIEGLKNASHLESLKIDFNSIKELEVPIVYEPGSWDYLLRWLFCIKQINKSGTQKCAQLLASLPFLKTLWVDIEENHYRKYTQYEYRELFEFFAQVTGIQQIYINDRNLHLKDYRTVRSGIRIPDNYSYFGDKTFEIPKNNNEQLKIRIMCTVDVYYEEEQETGNSY